MEALFFIPKLLMAQPSTTAIEAKASMHRRCPAGRTLLLWLDSARRTLAESAFQYQERNHPEWLRDEHEYPTTSTGSPVCQSEPIEIEIRSHSVKRQSERAKALCPISRIGSRRSPERQYDRRRKLLPACRTLFQVDVLGQRSDIGNFAKTGVVILTGSRLSHPKMSVTKSSRSKELSDKARQEQRRCRDWLLRFMQSDQPKYLTKDELRSVAMRELNVSKNSFDFGWIDAIETSGRHDWYEPLRKRTRTKN